MHASSIVASTTRLTTVIKRIIIDNIIAGELIALLVSVFAEGV
jgi:hypothetical protein